MTSILEKKYIAPERPYSQRELQFIRNRVFRMLRVGDTRANHQRCGHFYFVKQYGRKEKMLNENKTGDTGNCSVCWKIHKTPKYLKKKALDLIDDYCEFFETQPKYLSYDKVDAEAVFYTWLYTECKTV